MPYLAYTPLLKDAAAFIRDASQSSEVLVLAGTRGAANDLVRFHCGDVAGVHRLTLSRLIATLSAAPLAERGFVPVNPLGVEALAARAVHACRSRLNYFGPVASSPGFSRALARTILELRLHRPATDSLAATGLSGPDVALLLDTYEELLRESRLADFPAMIRLAQSQIGNHPLTGIPLVLLDVPVQSALMDDFVAKLRAAAPRTKTFVLAADDATATLPGVTEKHSTLDTLRANLFASTLDAAGPSDASFDFFSAAGEGLECTEIARRIQELAGVGIALDEIAILLRNPERYQPLLEEAFTRAKLPFYFTRGAVRPDPTGRAFLALLACKAEGYTATRFAEYLSFGQTPPMEKPRVMAAGPVGTEDDLLSRDEIAPESEEEEIEATPATPAAWERLIVDAAVVGGRHRWETRLRGLEQEFLLKLARLEGDETSREYLQRQLDLLRNLQQMALPAIERMDAMPRSAAWGEWLEHLTALAQLTLRQPDSVLLALNELWPMAEVGPVTLDEVFQVLADRLRFLRRPPNRRRYGQVWIGTIEEARAQSFRIVFLPGLSEGMFPKKALEDPLLLDNQRRQLDAALPKRDDRVSQERLRLHIAAAASAERIVISYPRMDVVQNRPRVPSFYAMEAVRAAEGRLPDLKDFEQRAARGALTRLGWPAPEDPQRSVDALEFDIASLQAAIKSGVRGSARYLLSLNPHLARSLRSRYMRWSSAKWTVADGLNVPDSKILESYRLHNRSWSASTLQLFSACPYKFVLHGIHHLRPREEPVPLEEMDALIRGSLFHQVQFEIFQRMQQGARAEDVANEVLDKVAKEYADKLAPAIPRVWQGEVEDLRADLQGWLRRMPEDQQNWRPAYSELSFGLPLDDGGRDPHSSPAYATVDGGYKVRGSIDWIDVHREDDVLRITDHKTGRPPKETPRYVGRGAVLQPLFYAAAASAIVGLPVKFSRLYYCTQRGAYRTIDFAITEESRQKLSTALSHIDQAIAGGVLPAAPGPDACKYCDFIGVCGRREEERVRKAKKPPLRQLDDLRSMP